MSTSTPLSVEPVVVEPNKTFTIRSLSGGDLLSTIECTLSSTATGETVQVNTMDVSGHVSLNLKDKFGAMQLEACNEQVCIEKVCFEYTFFNIGTGDMEMTRVQRTLNGGSTVDLLSLVSPNPLAPGEWATVQDKIDVDYCNQRTSTAWIDDDRQQWEWLHREEAHGHERGLARSDRLYSEYEGLGWHLLEYTKQCQQSQYWY
jgi:hypothetical protein